MYFVKSVKNLRIKTPEEQQWRRFGAFMVNFEQTSHILVMFLLLTWSR